MADIPKIRFKGFTEGWEERQVGEVLAERVERANGDEELLSVTIGNGVIRQADSDKRNIASEDKSNYKIVRKGDIPYNSMRMWQGAVGNSEYNGIVSPAYTVLVPTTEANSKFFMELFKKESTLKIFQRWSQGLTSDTWNLKYPVLSSIEFYIPSLEEQTKIAECFQSLDHLIILQQSKCDETKRLKKYMLQKMFPKNGEKIPEIRFAGFNGDWEQCKVGEYLVESREVGHKGDAARKMTVKLWGKGVYQKNETGSTNTQYFVRHANQFIYSKLDFLNCAFGVVPEELESLETTADVPAFDCYEIDPYFMFYTAIQPQFYLKNGIIADGSRKAKRIHTDIFLNMLFFVPCIEEQRSIVNALSHLDHLITLHQRKCDELKEVKKFMLQNMFPQKG